jgi:hypothetical protein
MAPQLAGELTPDADVRRLVLSASQEIEPGARAMLLLAEGLFRIDVAIEEDTIRTVVRNLSPGKLEPPVGSGYAIPTTLATAGAARYKPSGTRFAFALGAGADRVGADVTIALLRFPERGTIQVTAQAIVRQAPAE